MGQRNPLLKSTYVVTKFMEKSFHFGVGTNKTLLSLHGEFLDEFFVNDSFG